MVRDVALIRPALSTTNVGDLFIDDSARRILRLDAGRCVDVDPRRRLTERQIALINECDAAIIVGTNLWYRAMRRRGRWAITTGDLRRIRVPIIPLGVGTTRHANEDNGFDSDTLAQLRLIHESCNLASARDARTAEALEAAGIRNVAMTGCPTIFRSLSPVWRLRCPSPSRRVVVTVRKGQRENVRRLIRVLQERGLEVTVAAQQRPDLFLRPWLPWGQPAVPILYRFDIAPYLELVEQSLGAIGWRLHGTMLHLAHGNPAILAANCSRGDSFCDVFSLPRIRCEDGTELTDAQIHTMVDQLLDPRTFAMVPTRYAQHRATMVEFLQANGIPHNLAISENPATAADGR